jgi:hypothetical protein
MGQLVTVATGEDRSAEKNCHTTPASLRRAKEPRPPPTNVAACPFQSDGIFHRLPVATTASASVVENHVVNFRSHLNGCHSVAIARPMPAEGRPGVSRPSRCSCRISSGRMSLVVYFPRCPRRRPMPPIIFLSGTCRNRLASSQYGFRRYWLKATPRHATPSIEPVFTVLHFMRRAGLSASTASPECARTCDPDGFRWGSGSPTGALAAPLPRFGL